MVDIRTNLLKGQSSLSDKDYLQEKALYRYAVLGLVASLIIVSGLAIWNFLATRTVSAVEEEVLSLSVELQSLTEASAKQVYSKSRIDLISDFLDSRAITREAMQNLLSTSIPGTYVAGVAFEGENNLSVSYVADSITTLSELLEYYSTDGGYFDQVVSRGLTRSKDGTYQASLSMSLPGGGK